MVPTYRYLSKSAGCRAELVNADKEDRLNSRALDVDVEHAHIAFLPNGPAFATSDDLNVVLGQGGNSALQHTGATVFGIHEDGGGRHWRQSARFHEWAGQPTDNDR